MRLFSIDFYTRGDYVPGLRVDGMDVLCSKNAFAWAKQYALKKGPLVMEMETYRYVGHSMSDPGISYRSKEEVAAVREKRDPIQKHKTRILEHSVATEDELAAIDADIKKQVDAAVKFATEAPLPNRSELFTDVMASPVRVRGRSIVEWSQ